MADEKEEENKNENDLKKKFMDKAKGTNPKKEKEKNIKKEEGDNTKEKEYKFILNGEGETKIGQNLKGSIEIELISDMLIENYNIDKFGTGIYAKDVKNSKIKSVTVNNNWNGIDLYNSSNNIITNNTANYNIWSGIRLESSSNNNTLTSNTANNNNWQGIMLSFSSYNTLTNNTVNNSVRGIYLWGSNNSNNLFQRNFAFLNKGDGFYIEGGESNIFVKDIFIGNSETGITVENYSKDTTIIKPLCLFNGDTGINSFNGNKNLLVINPTLLYNKNKENKESDLKIDKNTEIIIVDPIIENIDITENEYNNFKSNNSNLTIIFTREYLNKVKNTYDRIDKTIERIDEEFNNLLDQNKNDKKEYEEIQSKQKNFNELYTTVKTDFDTKWKNIKNPREISNYFKITQTDGSAINIQPISYRIEEGNKFGELNTYIERIENVEENSKKPLSEQDNMNNNIIHSIYNKLVNIIKKEDDKKTLLEQNRELHSTYKGLANDIRNTVKEIKSNNPNLQNNVTVFIPESFNPTATV